MFFSCGTDNRQIIAGDRYRIWRCIKNMSPLGYYYKFDKSGNWSIVDNPEIPFPEMDAGDKVLPNKWNLKDDTLLIIGSDTFYIHSINNEMMVLINSEKLQCILERTK